MAGFWKPRKVLTTHQYSFWKGLLSPRTVPHKHSLNEFKERELLFYFISKINYIIIDIFNTVVMLKNTAAYQHNNG